ncbi:MAG: glutamate--tRNA ligase [Candidatus Tagabacteria bacterium]
MNLKFWSKYSKNDKKCQERQVRTRFAPSPTGPLHIGSARSALFNYLFARQNGGEFILRIENTDVERSNPLFEKDILDGFKWLGIWDKKPYRQSERIKIYKKYIERLLEEGKAFWCPHTKEDLAKEKQEQMAQKEAPRHICEYKNIKTKNKKGEIIRLDTLAKIVEFEDIIRGKIKFDTSLLGDIALAKDENTPLYNFAVVIDDFEMKISHVIRGEDHISNTPKQILIQEALGLPRPQYAHLPLVLGPDRSKLSKRHGPVSISEYRKLGYLPEVIINFIALLGWNPGTEQEIFSLDELIKKFDLNRAQKGGAIFNIERLDWLNGIYVRKKSAEELTDLILRENFLKIPKGFKNNYIEKVIALEQSRLQKLSEIGERTTYFFFEPTYPKSMLFWQSLPALPTGQAGGRQEKEAINITKEYLDKIVNLISNIKTKDFTKERIKETIWPYAEEKGRGDVLWPFRVALTGQRKSPDPFEIAEILGKKTTLKRLNYAIDLLNT